MADWSSLVGRTPYLYSTSPSHCPHGPPRVQISSFALAHRPHYSSALHPCSHTDAHSVNTCANQFNNLAHQPQSSPVQPANQIRPGPGMASFFNMILWIHLRIHLFQTPTNAHDRPPPRILLFPQASNLKHSISQRYTPPRCTAQSPSS
jgi:hypothetical protein